MRSLERTAEWAADGTGVVFAAGLSRADETLLARALQTGELIGVPTGAGVCRVRVLGTEVQQVWGGPNYTFYRLEVVRAAPSS